MLGGGGGFLRFAAFVVGLRGQNPWNLESAMGVDSFAWRVKSGLRSPKP